MKTKLADICLESCGTSYVHKKGHCESKPPHTPTITKAEGKFFFKVIGEGPYQIQHKSGLIFPFNCSTLALANDLINNIKDKVNWDFNSFKKLPYWVQVAIGEKVRDIYDRHNNEGYLS